MPKLKITNNAVSRLSANISASDTSISVLPGGGAKFPALAADEWFPATIVKVDGTLEIVRVTARATDVMTIERGQEATAAISFSAGDRVEHRFTAAAFTEENERIEGIAQSAVDSIATSIATLVNTLASSVGSSMIGFIQSGIGAVIRTVKSKLQDHLDAKDFGAVCDGITDDTDAIARLIAHCKLKNKRAELTGDIAAKWIVLQDLTYNFTLHGNNVMLYVIGTTYVDGFMQITNCVDLFVTGSFHIYGSDNDKYESIIRIKAIDGTSQACSRIHLKNITVRRAAFVPLWIGSVDSPWQCSEITIENFNTFQCTSAVRGSGVQSGATFSNCNLVSEENPAFPFLPYRTLFFEGGFWYIVGGEIVQPSAEPGNIAIECRPADSDVYENPYPIVKVSNVHIENSGLLVLLNNTDARGPVVRSDSSSISFSNCGGFMGSSGLNVIDTSGDPFYSGKIVFNNGCDFYGNSGVNRVRPHIVLGAKTKIDLDGSPFGQSFYPGLAGLFPGYMGKPRLRGETIVSCQASTSMISDVTFTTVDFPSSDTTNDTGYGYSTYSSGIWTAGQDMKDVEVDYQLSFASACPLSDSYVAVNGANTGSLAVVWKSSFHKGRAVIPYLAEGSTISIQARTASGSAIALTGSTLNYIRIRASTQ